MRMSEKNTLYIKALGRTGVDYEFLGHTHRTLKINGSNFSGFFEKPLLTVAIDIDQLMKTPIGLTYIEARSCTSKKSISVI